MRLRSRVSDDYLFFCPDVADLLCINIVTIVTTITSASTLIILNLKLEPTIRLCIEMSKKPDY